MEAIGHAYPPDPTACVHTGYVTGVAHQVDAAGADDAPTAVLVAPADGEAQRALHHAIEQRRGRGISRYGRVWQAGVALTLAQQRDLGIEQQAGPGQDGQLHGDLIVVVVVPSGAEKMIQGDLETVLVPVHEVTDLRVVREPRRGARDDAAFRTDGEAIAGGFLVLGRAARDLDVVEHELPEER